MKRQILKKHNPIIIFLTNFPCHASVAVYCLVFLELTSPLQGCFSALSTLSAFWLLSGTTSTGHNAPAPDTLEKRPLLPSKFCGSAESQGFSSSTGILFHSLLAHTAVIWVLLQCDLTFIPSSSQAVKESIIWNASEFTGLTLCQSLPPSLWCLVWKQNFSETTSCFEAKCNRRNLSNLSICFYSSPVLLQQTVQ